MKCPAIGCAAGPAGFACGLPLASVSIEVSGRMGGASAFSIGKLRDFLQLAFVEELEVFLLQRADGVPLRVANHHRHQHQIYPGAEGERRVALRYLSLLLADS